MAIKQKELGIYVHIPFCVSKCIYCDFLSMPMDMTTKENYVKSLCKEITDFANTHKDEYVVKSVFFGGGTPSILPKELMEPIFITLKSGFAFMEDCEITVECNPGTVDVDKLNFYKKEGVNRLSFGLQSVNNEELKALGRIHSFEDFIESYECAMKAGFSNINIDLMSALPGQTEETWKKTLSKIAMLKPSHISAYSLIIEEGTPLFDKVESGEINNLPDEDAERRIYEMTERILAKNGYHRYEISNYAKAGMECVHNKIYWQGGDYIGFGLGAASLIGRKRFSNIRNMNDYIENPLADKEDVTVLSIPDEMAEFMYLGLRMMEGISYTEFKNRFGRHIMNVYGEVINKYIGYGFLEETQDGIRLTSRGINVSNVIFSEFI